MTDNITVNVFLCIDSKTITVDCNTETYAEQLIIKICKRLNIGPLARHLFSLRFQNTLLWLPLNEKIPRKVSFEFRLRYKVPSLSRLKQVDVKAYDYYFHQARNDVHNNKIPDIVYENVKKELLGLGVVDMYITMLEKDLSKQAVESDYKKYIPKEVIKHHKFFIKKPVRDSLEKMKSCGHDAWYVKGEYLKQFETMAPEYMSEEYKALMSRNGDLFQIQIRISPYNKEQPGIRICYDLKKEWQQLSAIEDLCFISIRDDSTVEISRKNGIPINLKFDSVSIMQSFVSLLDGYYRLMCKWTFNLCKDMTTPTLQLLYAMKCHGPVGGEFSYAKLEEKRNNKPGCFILRESEIKYNIYYIDVCPKHRSKPRTYKIENLSEKEYIFHDDVTRYKSIAEIVAAYKNPDSPIYLHECLPPSEFDVSPLLLCQPAILSGDALADSDTIASSINGTPICIHPKDLQIYKGHKKESSNGVTIVYRCMWKLSKGKKIEVAMRVLKQEFYDKHLKEFMSRAGDWASLRDGSKGLVRLWGVTLAKPSALVLEYCRHGSLTQYLHQCKTGMCNPVQSVDLLEAASHIASALWHMQEQGIVHGKIRCRKVLVYMHNEDSFVVKLADPGIQSLYGFEEIHWIPIECYSNFEFVKHSAAADVWAFGTTLWEIYMYGETIPKNDHHTTMMFYSSGKRLPQPVECPDDIYKIMLDCWDPDQHKRIKPQAIMRDINQLLYQVFNSRKKHPYATVFPKIFPDTASISTTMTEETVLTQNDELLSVSAMNEVDSNLSISSGFSGGSVATTWLLNHSIDVDNNEDILSCDMSNILSNFHFGNTGSVDDISAIQTIFEIDASSNLVLQGRIGQGFYGEVFKGTLEGPGDSEPRQVAVKKLKTNALSTGLQDFEREISIMKTLNHPNIVKIFTVIDDPEISLIMEYVPHGSLQSYLKIYKESLTTKQLLNYASDVAKGMDYLAHKHIVHRDLAARNILVVDKNHVKISDFGLAQVVGKNEYYILQTNRDLPIKWYAPESLRDGKFSTKSDVWSFGVTMYEMFSHGEEPKLPMIEDSNGQEQQKLLDALESGARFLCPPTCPQSVFVRIMYPCWQKSPNERPSFHQLVGDIEDLLPQF